MAPVAKQHEKFHIDLKLQRKGQPDLILPMDAPEREYNPDGTVVRTTDEAVLKHQAFHGACVRAFSNGDTTYFEKAFKILNNDLLPSLNVVNGVDLGIAPDAESDGWSIRWQILNQDNQVLKGSGKLLPDGTVVKEWLTQDWIDRNIEMFTDSPYATYTTEKTANKPATVVNKKVDLSFLKAQPVTTKSKS